MAITIHLVLLGVQLIFCGFHVTAKSAMRQLHPLALAGLRVAVATPVLLLIATLAQSRVPASHPRIPGAHDQLRLALLGLFGVFTNQLLFILGLSHTTAINAGILMPSIPAFTVLVALVSGVERVSAGRLLGVLLSMAGALVLLRPHRFALDGTALGNLLVLANCLSYAIFLVLQRPMLRRLPPLTVIAWAFAWGGAGLVAVSWPHLAALQPQLFPVALWWKLGYIVVLGAVVVYPMNTWAIGRSSPVLVAAYTTLQPLGTAVLAAVLLGERMGWIEAVSFALIACGLWIVSRTRSTPPATHPLPRAS